MRPEGAADRAAEDAALNAAHRVRRAGEIFAEALEREGAERERFLRDASAGDDALRADVESLLAAHSRPGMMDRIESGLEPLAARLRGPIATLAGARVGRYQVIERIGGGGMGVVYRGLDTGLGRPVALKFLVPKLRADDAAAERFRLEARAIAALDHPNICTLYEIGEGEEGHLFLAMPLYEGETLQARIARGRLPIEEAVAIAVQVARGLAKAHARGIVHRDIKPSNVLVTADGIVKLLDFGIAKLTGVALTGASGPLGTTPYMSPEQAAGKPVDHRTDLWSLGVIVYEMLAGRKPFAGPTADEVSEAIRRREPPPLARLRPDVPVGLERVVTVALRKPREERYQTAQQFEADLLALGLAGTIPAGAITPSPPAGTARGARAGVRLTGRALAVAALLLLAVALFFVLARTRRATAARIPESIAVLPFADRSASGNQEYFSNGITDDLIASLGRVQGLRVASRTSAFAYRESTRDIRTVGAELGVGAVLEGTVRREANRLRITAQLVNVADGYQLWSGSYDRDAGDAFRVQEEIAAAIAQALRMRLVGAADSGASAPAVPNPAAYDHYLKGRYAWYTRSEAGLRAAAAHFSRAVAEDSGYARAYAGLADAYAVLAFYYYLSPAEAFPRARAAAERAVALDPALAAPRATLGDIALYYDWDLARGEEEFRRAIALDPSYSTAHQWYANLLVGAGRFAEAEREMRWAQEQDPLSLIASAALGWVLYYAGDYAAAAEQCRQTLELDPGYGPAHLWRGWALQELGLYDAAIESHRRAVAAEASAVTSASLARTLALAGQRDEAERLLRELTVRGSTGDYVPAYELAKVHEALGRPDEAFRWLERALAERSHAMALLRVDPQLRRLRSDPRFDSLAARVVPRPMMDPDVSSDRP